MAIIGGCDGHRQQITFDDLDTETSEVRTGELRPATRPAVREWLAGFDGRPDVAFAVEGCTGWRFVVEELRRAGATPHLAEPADTASLRGRKKRAKTDRADAKLLRGLLQQGRLPVSWVPPTAVLEVRTRGRLYVSLMDERRAWQQRIHAQLFQQGVPPVRGLLTADGQAALAAAALSPAGRELVDSARAAIDHLSAQIDPLRARLQALGRAQPGARALTACSGIGPLTAVIIWAELGDCRRAPGHLARQGSPALRWALYEAAKASARTGSPDHAYHVAVRERVGGKRPALSVARTLARRAHHILRAGGDAAWVGPTDPDAIPSAA